MILNDVVIESFAKKAFRTILIAYTDYTYAEYTKLKENNNQFQKEEDREVLERNMNIIGICNK